MSRNGGALLGALLLILLLGGLGALAFAAGRLRSLAGAHALAAALAVTAAEAGVERAEAAWDPIVAGRLGIGSSTALPPRPAMNGVGSQDTLLRLGRGLYLVRSVGERRAADGHLEARAGVARLIRLEGPGIPDSVAAFVGGGVTVSADSGIRGEDAIPPFWDSVCPPATVPGIGVASAPSAGVTTLCPSGACLTGSPPASTDSALPGGLFAQMGVATPAVLVRHAEAFVSGVVVPGPALAGAVCDRQRADNWGDPLAPGAPCGDYFPIIAASPGTEVTGGAGQGLLLAAGSLTLSGTSQFRGVILALADLVLEDDAEVYGVVLVQGQLLVGGNALVQRSTCGVRRGLEGSARPLRPVARGALEWP